MKRKVLASHIAFKKTSVNSIPKLKDIERYVGRFINSSNKPLEDFGEKELTNFINSVNGKYTVRTVNDIKVFLKVFLKWHYEDWSSRFRNLDRLCKTKLAPKSHEAEQMLSQKEIDKLIDGEQDPMWKVYWAVFYYGGMRPSECCRIKWKDISFDKEGTTIKVFSEKNNRTFYKSIPDKVSHSLKEWKKFNSSDLVFPSPFKKDNPISNKTAYQRMIKLSKRVLGKEVYPYTIRHSLATIKYNDDSLKPDDVANQMGHSKSMKPTYTNLSEEQLKKRARKLWIETKLPPEKKHELENKIHKLEGQLGNFKALIDNINKKITGMGDYTKILGEVSQHIDKIKWKKNTPKELIDKLLTQDINKNEKGRSK